jgi:hypothetical protein
MGQRTTFNSSNFKAEGRCWRAGRNLTDVARMHSDDGSDDSEGANNIMGVTGTSTAHWIERQCITFQDKHYDEDSTVESKPTKDGILRTRVQKMHKFHSLHYD